MDSTDRVQLGVLVVLTIGGVFGVHLGWLMGRDAMRTEAANVGAGVYHTDGKGSQTTFYWVVP